MENKYLEKIAKVLPNFKQFGGIKGALETATLSTEHAGKFANPIFKNKRVAEAEAEKLLAKKELAKGVGLVAAGTLAIGAAVHHGMKEKAEENKYLTQIVKEAGLLGSAGSAVFGAVKNFAKGAVTDAGKIGRQASAVGKGLGVGGRGFNGSRAWNGVKMLANNKAVQGGAGILGAGYLAGRSNNGQ